MGKDQKEEFYDELRLFTPERLAEKIKSHKNWKEGMEVQLYICHAGTGGEKSFAQRLSDAMGGTTVKAADTTVWYTESGKGIVIAPKLISNPGVPDILNQKNWISFWKGEMTVNKRGVIENSSIISGMFSRYQFIRILLVQLFGEIRREGKRSP